MPPPTLASEHHWQIYRDWCIATGREVDTLHQEFFDDVPVAAATQVSRSRAIFARLGHQRRRAERIELIGSQPAWRQGQQWGSLTQSLATTPRSGWVSGLRGGRDAFVLVAAAVGMTRDELRLMTHQDVITDKRLILRGAEVPMAQAPLSCPGCAVIGWLSTLGIYRKWGMGIVRAEMIRAKHSPARHICMTDPGREWRLAPALVPSVDKHGWVEEHHPLSARTVSAITARRQAEALTAPQSAQEHRRIYRSEVNVHRRRHLSELSEMLDEIEHLTEAHEEMIRRVEQETARFGRAASGQ